MFNFTRWLRPWWASLRASTPPLTQCETMNLHDWADLPVYHPLCD